MPPKKNPSEKKVAVIFNLPPKLRDALNKKVPAGSRSKFVVELIARELKVATPKLPLKTKTKQKCIFSRFFSKK